MVSGTLKKKKERIIKVNCQIINVCSVKKDTKRSSLLLLRLVSFFTEQTLLAVSI